MRQTSVGTRREHRQRLRACPQTTKYNPLRKSRSECDPHHAYWRGDERRRRTSRRLCSRTRPRRCSQRSIRGRLQTRFPPEPNGYLHIGHAKAITLDFELANEFGGICTFGSTTQTPIPKTRDTSTEFLKTLSGLGTNHMARRSMSDYFEQLYEWAEHLISEGLAYVDDQDAETISVQRGGFGRPGIESPFRDVSLKRTSSSFARCETGNLTKALESSGRRSICNTKTCSCGTR